MASDIAARVIRHTMELRAAQDALRAAKIVVPLGLDSAASVYAHGLEALGLPVNERIELWKGGVGALKTVFAVTVANPAARHRLALDSAQASGGFASRFPKATPMRSV